MDASNTVWSAPPSALTDGTSIPQVFVPLVGNPRSPEFLAAAALHDAYCGAGNKRLDQFHARDWEATHRMFYDSLGSVGVSATKAKIMFAAVYLGGPQWDDPARSLEAASEERLRAEMERCIAFTEGTGPSVAEVERWMRNREAALLSSENTGP